jgi:hypothetical protein
VEFGKVKIGAEKPGNDHDSGSISARYTQAVVHGRGVQQENLSPE